MAIKKTSLHFSFSIIRTLLFLYLFVFIQGKEDYLDTFLDSASPLPLMTSILVGRILLGMLLFYPLAEWVGLWQNKFVKRSRIVFLVLLAYILITLNYSSTFYYQGKNIQNTILAIGFLLPFVLLLLPSHNRTLKFPAWSTYLLFIIAIASPNILSPPDLYPFQKKHAENLNTEAFYAFASHSSLLDSTAENQLVAFYAANCRFCRFAAVKVDGFIKQNDVDINDVVVFFAGKFSNPSDYFTMQNLTVLPHDTLRPHTLFSITNRAVPAILHLQYGKVVGTYRFRTFNDREIMRQWKKTVTD